MSQLNDSEALFALIRKQFFEDPEENMEKLRDSVLALSEQPQKALAAMRLCLHNLKGSAQAVGLSAFAEHAHLFEDCLEACESLDKKHLALPAIVELLRRASEDFELIFQSMRTKTEDCAAPTAAFQRAFAEVSEKLKSKPAPPAAWGLFDDDEDVPATIPVTVATIPASVAAVASAAPIVPVEVPLESIKTAIPVPAEVPQESKFLLLEQQQKLFAVNIQDVKEIVSNHVINPLPAKREGLKGMIVVRDRTLPVLDLDEVFGGSSSLGDRICAVICESEDQSFAFRVEKPRHVISLHTRDFENLEGKIGSQTGDSVIKRVATYNGKSVLVIDLRSLLKAS